MSATPAYYKISKLFNILVKMLFSPNFPGLEKASQPFQNIRTQSLIRFSSLKQYLLWSKSKLDIIFFFFFKHENNVESKNKLNKSAST